MSKRSYPFVSFVDEEGETVRPPSTYLPVRITNPDTGQSVSVYALIDTGADQCAFPKSIAVDIGHNFDGTGVKSETTLGVSGTTPVFLHTFDVDILTPDRQDVFASFKNVLVSCVPVEIPPLLGVADCLGQFVLTIDYPNGVVTLEH